MSTRQSVRAILAVALGVAVVGCANDKGTPPEKTFLTVSGTSTIAFSMNADHLVEMSTVGNSASAGGGGGGGFFSASVATGGSFSSEVAGSGTFSSSTGGSASFSSALAGSGSFSSSSILTPGSGSSSCNLQALCNYVSALCSTFSGADAASCNQGAAQCSSLVSSSAFQKQLADELLGANVPPGFMCAILDFLECVGPSLSNLDEATAMRCANEAGLADMIQSLGQGSGL